MKSNANTGDKLRCVDPRPGLIVIGGRFGARLVAGVVWS